MHSTSSSVSTVSTSCSSAQENLLPSPSAIITTIQSESLLKIPNPITTTTTSPGNNLNTSVSSLETKTQSVPTTSNSEHSNAPEIPQCVERNSRNRRKRPKVQNPGMEIKMTPDRPRKSAPTEYATDEEDMITYDVEEEELEPDPMIILWHYILKYDQARRRFIEWAQNEIAVVPDFHNQILFSDEAHFWLNGYVNKQNCRIWSEANPQVNVEIPLHTEKLTVWCALWAGGILLKKRFRPLRYSQL
ncbi:putative transposable element [Trichonephila clavipes]|nr:putative transposable element [Trichonephila clavipes]